MPDNTTETKPVTRTIAQYRARGLMPGDDGYMTGADAAATAMMMLRQQFHDNGELMTAEPVAGDPQPVVVNADYTGWTDWAPGNPTPPTGDVVMWTATGRPAQNPGVEQTMVTDADTVLPGALVDGHYEAQVTEYLTEAGGSARVRHGLGSEDVIVSVWAGDTKVGYLFALTMSENEVHVEFFAGATVIRVDDLDA